MIEKSRIATRGASGLAGGDHGHPRISGQGTAVRFRRAVPPGGVAYSPEQAVYVATELGGWHWAIKAQIHAGGRGKAGGVKLCRTYHEVAAAAQGDARRDAGHRTRPGPQGKVVHRLYIEKAEPFVRAALPRVRARPQDRAHPRDRLGRGRHGDRGDRREPPRDAILQQQVDPAVGLQAFQARELAFGLGLNIKQVSQAVTTIMGCYRAFRDLDATMVEINPLVVTKDDRVLALDAKMSFDDNAMFRRRASPRCAMPRRRIRARRRPRSSASTMSDSSGDIGCIINGAGLAMATMDMIKHAGGEPANFLDVGGGASPERVAAAFNLVLSDKNVKAILVNIFAGINRCDWVAQGVVQAAQDLRVPLVVRLAGTNVEEGRRIIAEAACPSSPPTRWRRRREKAVAASRARKVTR